jgi:hypothetical protein
MSDKQESLEVLAGGKSGGVKNINETVIVEIEKLAAAARANRVSDIVCVCFIDGEPWVFQDCFESRKMTLIGLLHVELTKLASTWAVEPQ